jgi:hypothetical protein
LAGARRKIARGHFFIHYYFMLLLRFVNECLESGFALGKGEQQLAQ